MTTEFDLLIEEYHAIRAEILQSISKQHQITLGGYALTGAIFGYIVSASKQSLEFLLVIPLGLLAMAALWAVECNRNIRASYYIGFKLWPALMKVAGATSHTEHIGWETWIRNKNGNASEFRIRQHRLQLFVLVILPFLISLVSLSLASLHYG